MIFKHLFTPKWKHPKQHVRLEAIESLDVPTTWLTLPLLNASFIFNKGFYADQDKVKVNYLGSNVLYQYHQKAWEIETEFSN